jgi:hypothetical protein
MQSLDLGRLALLCGAIAHADGFWTSTSSPRVFHNPGDRSSLAADTWHRLETADAWALLAHQVDLMLSGRSYTFRPDMTWRAIARHWTAGENTAAWLETVCQVICVSPDDELQGFSHPRPVEHRPSDLPRA